MSQQVRRQGSSHADANDSEADDPSDYSSSCSVTFNDLPQFALHGIVSCLTFPEAYRIPLLSKGWSRRMCDDDLVWKVHLRLKRPGLVTEDDASSPPLRPPRYFYVAKGDVLCLKHVAHAFGVDVNQLSVRHHSASAAAGSRNHDGGGCESSSSVRLQKGSVVCVNLSSEANSKNGSPNSADPEAVQHRSKSWRQRHKDSYLTDLLLRFLCHARVDTVKSPHEFGCRRVADLPPLPATITNSIYHYNNVLSRSKTAWLADRYLCGFQTQVPFFGRVSGRCIGSTPSSGWIILGDRERARNVVADWVIREYYGLGCINNRNDGAFPHSTRYESSMQLLLDIFFEVTEPGAMFLSASHVLHLEEEEEGEQEVVMLEESDEADVEVDDMWRDHTNVYDMDKEGEQEVVVLEASDEADVDVDDFMRNHTDGYDLNKDRMVVAVGRTRVVSFYWYLKRYYG